MSILEMHMKHDAVCLVCKINLWSYFIKKGAYPLLKRIQNTKLNIDRTIGLPYVMNLWSIEFAPKKVQVKLSMAYLGFGNDGYLHKGLGWAGWLW